MMARYGVDNDPYTLEALAERLEERQKAIFASTNNLASFLEDMRSTISEAAYPRFRARMLEHKQELDVNVGATLEHMAAELRRMAAELHRIIEAEERI